MALFWTERYATASKALHLRIRDHLVINMLLFHALSLPPMEQDVQYAPDNADQHNKLDAPWYQCIAHIADVSALLVLYAPPLLVLIIL